MAEERDPLTTELQYLRKGEGITLTKLSVSPEVLRICGATAEDPQPALDRITETIDRLKRRRRARALRNAYAIDQEDPGLLGDRRHRFANEHRRGPDSIENWENDGIAELRLLLLAQQPGIEPPPGAGGLLMGAYKMDRLEAKYRYENRLFRESLQTRSVVALVDNADGFIYATHILTRLTVIRGGEPVELERNSEGWIRHKIMFGKTLSRGEDHEFVLREEMETPDEEAPAEDKISQIFHIPTAYFWVDAHFQGEVPPLVWSFDKLTHFERPGTPTPHNPVPIQKNHATHEFENLYGGLFSGIAWKWKL